MDLGKDPTWGVRLPTGVHMGHDTLWDQNSRWVKDSWVGAPLRLYKRVFYDPRPDLYKRYARGPEWYKVQYRWRFFQALFPYLGPPSHLLWNLKWPLLACMLVTGLLEMWAGLRRTCCPGLWPWDTDNELKVAFQLTSFAMSVLLAVRIQQAYAKFMQARQALGGQINGVMSMIQQSLVWIPDRKLQWDILRWGICMVYSFHHALRSEVALDPKAAALLTPEELAIYSGSRKSRQICFMRLKQLVTSANLPFEKFMAVDGSLTKAWQEGGAASRIKYTPLPQAITILSSGFTLIWCLLLPLGLYNEEPTTDGGTIFKHLLMTFLISLLLLGIDEVAIQLDNPFNIMPFADMVDVFWNDAHRNYAEIISLQALDAPKAPSSATSFKGSLAADEEDGPAAAANGVHVAGSYGAVANGSATAAVAVKID